MRLNLGLAGVGIHGSRYARHLLAGEVDNARLTAICRHDADAGRRFAEGHALRFAASVAELAALDGVDAVLLVLPPDLHGGAALEVLRAGKPVYVEKPLASDVTQARALVDRVERHSGRLMVGHTLRFDPLVGRLREELRELGPLQLLAINQRFEPTDRRWIDRPGAGGILLNTAVHGFDLLRFLTGCEARSIDAHGGRHVTRETDDLVVCSMRFEPGGLLATLDNARCTDSRSGRIEIVGRHGQLWADHIHRTYARVRGRQAEERAPIAALPTIPIALRAFVDCCLRDREFPVSVVDGLRAVELVEAAERSIAAAGRVEL